MQESFTALRRAECERCLRPQRACVCAFAAPLATQLDVLILQHPLEEREAKGTARLLHLSLPGSQLVVGETFDEAALRDLLFAGGRQSVLLYPPTDGGAPLWQPYGVDPATLRLVILDGTWRKSRKLLACNPLLQSLPRLALPNVPPSAYQIRKAHAPHQLSTLEAAACAIARIDPGADLAPLQSGFDAFIRRQAAFASRALPLSRRTAGTG